LLRKVPYHLSISSPPCLLTPRGLSGIESGGHGHSGAPPLLSLIPAILSVLPNGSPPLIAAGGLSQGAHVASVLTLGASGAVLGTRFLLTPESLYSDRQKRALIDASATTRTIAFDHVRGTLGWPHGVDGRGLPNKTVEEFEKGVTLDELKRKYSPDDPDRMVVWAGTGVASMSVIKSALVKSFTYTVTRLMFFLPRCNRKLSASCIKIAWSI
jgi:nitronate monooxygenase